MDKEKKYMPGEELVKRILAGQHIFSMIRIDPNFDVTKCSQYNSLCNYLRTIDPTKHLEFVDCEMVGFTAPGIQMPYASFNHSDLKGANLEGAVMLMADFYGTDFRSLDDRVTNLSWTRLNGSNLMHAKLNGADARGAVFYLVKFEEADFDGTMVSGTNFERAELVYPRNLDKAVKLGEARFDKTRVDPQTQEIILNALKELELFIVQEEQGQ